MIDIGAASDWYYFDKIFEKKDCHDRLSLPISQQKEKIREQIYRMKTMGMTALGPSALVSYNMLKMHAIGSNIVIFTDGSTN